MSKSNRIIVFVMLIIVIMATVYFGHYIYQISRLMNHSQQKGWYEVYDTKNN